MDKYGKVRRLVQQGVKDSRQEELVDCEFRVSPLSSIQELTTTHCSDYVQRFLVGDQTVAEQRNVGFPWSPAGVDRAQSSVGGTVAAARDVCTGQQSSHQVAWAAHVAGGVSIYCVDDLSLLFLV
jgi:acetoin utilization deacetylase AcuC-like enzyme